MLRVAIQGELGAFSHEAAIGLARRRDRDRSRRPRSTRCSTAVLAGKADRALVPIENSLAGSIHENYDRLQEPPLHIVAETQLRIRLCLIARPGRRSPMLRRVASHPVALGQCRRFFAEHPAGGGGHGLRHGGQRRRTS